MSQITNLYQIAVQKQEMEEMSEQIIDIIHQNLAIPGTASGVAIGALALATRKMAETYNNDDMNAEQVKVKACEIILERKITISR